MAREHRNAISCMDDLIAAVHFNSICYVVQASAGRAARRRISPLTFSEGIHVSSRWKFTHGEQRLRGYDTVVSSVHELKYDTA